LRRGGATVPAAGAAFAGLLEGTAATGGDGTDAIAGAAAVVCTGTAVEGSVATGTVTVDWTRPKLVGGGDGDETE
jgi:hypothetical protein